MSRFRVFDPETAIQLTPRIITADKVDVITSGEYFSADDGDVILAPSVKEGDVLYIRIRSAVRPETAAVTQPASIEPAVQARPSPAAPVNYSPTAPVAASTESTKHYVASGFLGLDGDVEEETPEPPKPWWKRLID